MPKQETVSLRTQLAALLRMKGAHVNLENALADFPPALRGAKPNGVPHSAWQLLEHMRIAQADLLDFSRNPKHTQKQFPGDYWPVDEAPPSDEAWESSIQQFQRNLEEMLEMVGDTKRDLLVKLPHGTGQTLLRQALVVADHNSYHLGQLMFLKKMLEAQA
jgi:hypothetical protein